MMLFMYFDFLMVAVMLDEMTGKAILTSVTNDCDDNLDDFLVDLMVSDVMTFSSEPSLVTFMWEV